MPSSSSSEEDLSKFREATDNFYNVSLCKETQDRKEENPLVVTPPSLRYIEEEERHGIHNELKVTPSFQKHVAKHLSKLLDRQLELNDTSTENSNPPDESRKVLKGRRSKNSINPKIQASANANNYGGVRLLGASAVFLSNLNIVPSTNRRAKRGRKTACFSSGSESSSEEIDSDDTAANISQSRILSGNTAKELKMSKPLLSDPSKDDLSRGYESLNEIGSNSNHLSIEALSMGAKDDMAFLSLHKKKKAAHLESELAASVSSMLSLGSDSQGDVPVKMKKKKMKKKKKRRKEQYSEDATTETTEVEDIVEERRKKVKKPRRVREKERKAEKMAMIKECVPGLLDETEENDKCKECKKKKKKKKRNKVKGEESFLKKQNSRFKLSKASKQITKKKMSKNVSRLSEDLAKLMMNSNEAP